MHIDTYMGAIALASFIWLATNAVDALKHLLF
jgi:hypothetical protein